MIGDTVQAVPDRETVAMAPQPDQGLFQRFIAGNYFYFFSAALMLLGCYMMMHATALTSAIFLHALKTLLILQGYEVLVIATSLVIVWRLKTIDDAFSLLLVELLLLLDPTFFSNSFFTILKNDHTMLATQGVLVNVVCFVLVPLKLAILQRGLKLRFSNGCWAAFIFAAVFAYLAEGPLSRRMPLPFLTGATYHYLLAWGPLLLAFLAPPLKKMAVSTSADAQHITPERLKALGVLLIVLPLVVIVAHLVESARVHELKLYPFDFAPLALAIGVILIRQIDFEIVVGKRNLLLLVDACAIAALLLSSRWFNPVLITGKARVIGYAVETLPSFPMTGFPLILGGAGVIGLYLLFYAHFRYRPALYRVMLLALAGGAAFAASFDAVRHFVAESWVWLRRVLIHAADLAKIAAQHVFAILQSAYMWIAKVFWVMLDAVRHFVAESWVWLRRVLTYAAGLVKIVAQHVLPILKSAFAWIVKAFWATLHNLPEILQVGLLMPLVIDHCRKRPRFLSHVRIAIGGMVIIGGLMRYGITQAFWSGAVCGAEFALLLLAGWRWREYLWIAPLQALVFLAISLGYPNWFSNAFFALAKDAATWLSSHPGFIIGIFWLGFLGLAVRLPNFFTWLFCGMLSIWILSGWLPRSRENLIPELIQSVMILCVALDHRFNPVPSRGGRYVLVLSVAVIALVRFADTAKLWTGAIVGAEAISLLACAMLLSHPGYALLALAELAGCGAICWTKFDFQLSPGMMVILAGMIFFATGIVVTFNKERLLFWINTPHWEPEAFPQKEPCDRVPEIPSAELEREPAMVAGAAAPRTPPSPPPILTPAPPPLEIEDDAHLLKRVQTLFATDPDFSITLGRGLPPEFIEQIQAGAIKGDVEPVFLIKGAVDSKPWDAIPAWICFPADAKHEDP